jgi:hypothetical protein
LTADNDKATKTAFFWGRTLSNLFDSHSSDEQQQSDIRAIGHYEPYQTHVIEDVPGEGSGCGKLFSPIEETELNWYSENIEEWQKHYSESGKGTTQRAAIHFRCAIRFCVTWTVGPMMTA